MLGPRHNLALLVGTLLLLGNFACDEQREPSADAGPLAADSGGDAQTSSAGYQVCDGSDRIRLGYQSGGGFVEEGYYFEQPYGMQFLFVDGHCDFMLAGYADPPGTFIRGHLDEDGAEKLGQQLALDELPTGVFFDRESCPDAGAVTLATARFYGDCSCGCDPGAPAALERALKAIDGVLNTVRAQGAAASGALEVAAVASGVAGNPGDAREWPFSWSVSDIVNVSLSDTSSPVKLRVLEGGDAEIARRLRDEANAQNADKRMLVQSGSAIYQLYVRDRVESELAEEIVRFNTEADPRSLRPISACASDRDLSVALGGGLNGHQLYTWFEAPPVCGVRICWDGELRETQPVVAPLRVVKEARPRPCLGLPGTSLHVDLEPIVEAFQSSYPGAKLEIELALPGWSDETLTLTETR